MSFAPDSPLRKILLVDDESAVIIVTKRMLEIAGYAVTGVTTAEEALRLFESQAWDLVIADRAMPVMDGEEMAEQMKQRVPQTPILLITGFPDKVMHCERYTGVVKKPFASVELLTQMALALEKEP